MKKFYLILIVIIIVLIGFVVYDKCFNNKCNNYDLKLSEKDKLIDDYSSKISEKDKIIDNLKNNLLEYEKDDTNN